ESFVLLDRMRAAQEHGRRAHVVLGAAGIFSGRRGDGSMGQIADHADAIAERFERLKGFGELETLPPPPGGALGPAPVCAGGVPAGTIDSSRGSASVTPLPRRNVRRDRCFFVMNVM